MISDDFVKQKNSIWKIDERTIYREYLQWLFLQWFYRQNFSQSMAYFKGGTALRLLFGSFRFSEDLDFTCTGTADDIEKVLAEVINSLVKETGLTINLRDRKYFADFGLGIRMVFSGLAFKQPLGIRLDFSFREKPLDYEVTIPECQDYPLSMFPSVFHYSKREILAEKVRAIFARSKVRDIFDLWFLLKNKEEIPWDMIGEKMKYYPKIEFSKEILSEKVNSVNPKDFATNLNQFLPINYRGMHQKFLAELKNFLL
ncbi:MAG: nucleotidyl transferase AbiEii/AbiGii toxin family protein [Patescibacteria group bacterium]